MKLPGKCEHQFVCISSRCFLYLLSRNKHEKIRGKGRNIAGAQACDCTSQVVGSIPTRGNETFNMFISSLSSATLHAMFPVLGGTRESEVSELERRP